MKTKHKIISGIILVIILMIVDKYIFVNYLNFDELFKQSLIDEGLTGEQMTMSEKIQNWIIPLSILVKIIGVLAMSGLLYLGCMLFNYEKNFKKIFQVTFLSYGVVVISKIVNSLWLKGSLDNVTSLTYLKKFSAISLQNVYDYNTISEPIFGALGELNLFRIVFWLLLAYGLKSIIKKPYWKAFEIVFLFNIIVFVLIVLAKLLLALNFS